MVADTDVTTAEENPEIEEENFDWSEATMDQIEMVFPILLPGFDIDEFNKKGLVKRIGKKARGRSPEKIVLAYNEKIEKKKQEISDEILALSTEDVQDLLERLGSSIDVAKRYGVDEMWKAYRLLEGKLKRKSLTIEAARELEKKVRGRRGRLSIIVTDLQNVEKPNGFPPEVSEFLQKLAAADKDAKIGRAKSARPLAVAKLPSVLGTNILYISLGKDYKLPEEYLKAAKDENEE